MKKVIILVITIVIIFVIALIFKDDKIYYLSLGDSLSLGITNEQTIDKGYSELIKKHLEEENILEVYLNNFSKKDQRTTDLANMINSNEQVKIGNKSTTIQNALIKADLITISIGMQDILNTLTVYESYNAQELYGHIDEFLTDLDTLLKTIREYCKENIILIGYYNFLSDNNIIDVIEYINQEAKSICQNHDIKYIIPGESFEKFTTNQDIHPNQYGYLDLFNTMKPTIDEIINKKRTD